jgi:hypothetical protein
VAVLPSADTLIVLQAISTLLLPEFVDVHKGTHGYGDGFFFFSVFFL